MSALGAAAAELPLGDVAEVCAKVGEAKNATASRIVVNEEVFMATLFSEAGLPVKFLLSLLAQGQARQVRLGQGYATTADCLRQGGKDAIDQRTGQNAENEDHSG